jgi:superfamily II DNA or RNA helicase
MMAYFQQTLYTPDRLGSRPIVALQERGILSRVNPQRLHSSKTPKMTRRELKRFSEFKDLPPEYLERLGLSAERNAIILARLVRIPRRSKTLVFACSVTHAEVLTLGLNRILGNGCAALVTADTPRAERYAAIERFRKGDLRYLCNVGVLSTGFDAPVTDVVCVTRPTASAVLYEQMVGRGLRGPLNGGTKECRVIDVQDHGLPREILSYARVMAQWC